MKILLTVLLLVVIQAGIAVGQKEVCDEAWYYIEMAACDAKFILSMNSSNQSLTDCPKLYKSAYACFKEKILNKCFDEKEVEKRDKSVLFRERQFGDEQLFCVNGLLFSMESVMKDINETECVKPPLQSYTVYEKNFRDAFVAEFSKPIVDFRNLQKEFAKAQIGQSMIASFCHIPRNAETFHFYDSGGFNPYDRMSLERARDFADKIEHGESVKTSDATAVTVAIVGVVLLLIVAGVFLYLWRRDKNRAEIRRLKHDSKKGPSTSHKNGDTEMQPLAGAAVLQTSDEVASA